MADYFGSLKLCATCAYWIAQRDTDITNSRVINCETRADVPFRKVHTSTCAGSPTPDLVPIIKNGRCCADAPQQ